MSAIVMPAAVALPSRAAIGRLAATALLAGVAADLTWEVWARAITPLWVGGPLEPAALVQSVFGFQSLALAELIHAVVGVVFYPLGYLLIALPLARRLAPLVGRTDLPWPVTAFGYGVGLWIFALYVMAHLIAGLPPFLNFIPLAWASLVGHALFGLVVGGVVAARR
jgi:hypothetical protein